MTDEQLERRRDQAALIGHVKEIHRQLRVHAEKLHNMDERMLLWARTQQHQSEMLRHHMEAEESALAKYELLLDDISKERQYGRELKMKLLQSTLSWGVVGALSVIAVLIWHGLRAKLSIFTGAFRW